MPSWLDFQGDYTYLLTDGFTQREMTLGDYSVEIPIGLPHHFDDDGRVDDWEIIEAIQLWIQGRLSDEDLLTYVNLWQTTSFDNP